MADVQKQNFVIARLADFCNFRQRCETLDTRDPISYLYNKLHEIEEPLNSLKAELLSDAVFSFFHALEAGSATPDRLADFLTLLDNYLSRGDFADAAFHLDWENLKDPGRRKDARGYLGDLRACSLIDDEDKPPASRNPNWQRIVESVYKRLGCDLIAACHSHKPLTARRLRFFVRRIRFQSADFCAVFRFPAHAGDTFTPFILPRVEGLIAANRRILQILRSLPSKR